MPKKQQRICLVSCSVLKEEIRQLAIQGDLDVDFVFVSKYFHVDYGQVEKNLRPVLERALQRYSGNVVLVYGDLCLGADNEMKKLAEEYGVVKVDAINCIDCQLGGKGRFLEEDPNHDLMFLSPGMTEFFNYAKSMMRKENVSEDQLKQLFNGLRGLVLLDTLGNAEQLKADVEKLDTGLSIVETRVVGIKKLRTILKEAIERKKQKPEKAR
jgi:hypothetical protein